jgi:hypothetical protein
VGELEDVVEKHRGAGHEHAPLVKKKALLDTPGVTVHARGHRVATRMQVGIGLQLPAELVEEPEGGNRQGGGVHRRSFLNGRQQRRFPVSPG